MFKYMEKSLLINYFILSTRELFAAVQLVGFIRRNSSAEVENRNRIGERRRIKLVASTAFLFLNEKYTKRNHRKK